MKAKGKDMSPQARRALNRAVLDWLGNELDNINNDSLISEVFLSPKSNDLVLLRQRLREHLSHFRVLHKHAPKECMIQHEATILDDRADRGLEPAADWKRLSGPMVGAAMGQDHTAAIQARKKRYEQ